LFLLGSAFFIRVVLPRPTPAHADVPPQRLETFTNNNGTIQHRWSDDGGSTWSAWTSLPLLPNGMTFIGTPSAVSDGVTRLEVSGLGSNGKIYTGTYVNGAWIGWSSIPGNHNPWEVADDATLTGGSFFFYGDPVLTSWGPGRMDMFVYGGDRHSSVNDGIAPYQLLHTWTENGLWSGHWEALGGRGQFQGDPAVTSWGPGRTDVFARGLNNRLLHLYFDNGSWSSNWEGLGVPSSANTLSSSPTATSSGPGRLNVFARGSDGDLWGNWFAGGWGGWGDVGCCLAGDVSASVAATSQVPLTVDVFVVGTQHDLYRKANSNGYWADWQFLDHSLEYTNIAAAVWAPFAPDPPTETPPPPCRTGPCRTTP